MILKEIELKIKQQGKEITISAVIIYNENDAVKLSTFYFSNQKVLEHYPVFPERLENIHEQYIVFDCYLINIDPQIDYKHYYCALKKK